jgi:hypothetical protein
MAEGLTLAGWRARLEGRGHRVVEPNWATTTGFTLRPDADTVVTVAVDPDGTLYPQYRQRYFLCELEPEQVFRVMGCPGAHRDRWLGLLSQQPPGYCRDFLAGPGSWLLCRLARSQQVVAWSDKGLPWGGLDCPTHRHWGMEVPALAAPFFAPADGPEASLPRSLPVDDGRFADAVAACVLFASVGMRDCYLADADAAEVYLAHHHDKVVVFIPDVGARGKLLQELREASWLFTDVSGFGSSADEEGEDDEEAPGDG